MNDSTPAVRGPCEEATTFLRRPALRRRWGMSRSGFAALEKSGQLPQPVYIGSSRTPRWPLTAVVAYEEARRTLPATSRIAPAPRRWTTGFRRLDGTPLDDADCDGVKGHIAVERCDRNNAPTLADMGSAFAVAQLAALGVLVRPVGEGSWVIDSAGLTALLAFLGASDEE